MELREKLLVEQNIFEIHAKVFFAMHIFWPFGFVSLINSSCLGISHTIPIFHSNFYCTFHIEKILGSLTNAFVHFCCFFSHTYIKKFLDYLQKNGSRRESFICRFTSQVTAKSRAGPGQSWGPGALFGSLCGWQGLIHSPGKLERWIENGAAGIQTSSPMGCWHHRRWFDPLSLCWLFLHIS